MGDDRESNANAQARDRHKAREVQENSERAEARERVRHAQEQEKQKRESRLAESRERASHRPPPSAHVAASEQPSPMPESPVALSNGADGPLDPLQEGNGD